MGDTRNAEDYERAIAAAKINPKNLTTHQQSLLKSLSTEHGERGNRARDALNGK